MVDEFIYKVLYVYFYIYMVKESVYIYCRDLYIYFMIYVCNGKCFWVMKNKRVK